MTCIKKIKVRMLTEDMESEFCNEEDTQIEII